jgi:hypothetical protein
MTETNTDTPDRASSGTDDLIPVFNTNIGGTVQAAVDARELYPFFGVKRDFSSGIKRRITEYGFEEGQDYLSMTKMGDSCQKDKKTKTTGLLIKKGLSSLLNTTLPLRLQKSWRWWKKTPKAGKRGDILSIANACSLPRPAKHHRSCRQHRKRKPGTAIRCGTK